MPDYLLEYHWDGGAWSWSGPTAAPDSDKLIIGSTYVVDDTNDDRAGVLLRSGTGRIYDRARVYRCAGNASIGWTDISRVQPLIVTPGAA